MNNVPFRARALRHRLRAPQVVATTFSFRLMAIVKAGGLGPELSRFKHRPILNKRSLAASQTLLRKQLKLR